MHFVMWQHETLKLNKLTLNTTFAVCFLAASLVGQLAGYILS
jgi:hypothetical protein